MRNALVYVDPDAAGSSLELLAVIRQLYGREDVTSYGLCIGMPADEARGFLDTIISVTDIQPYDVPGIAVCITELHHAYRFDLILFPATVFGRMLAPRTAMRLRVGLVAEVSAVRRRNGQIEMIRPAFGGRMMASIVNHGPAPVLMSVRPDTFHHDGPADRNTAVIGFSPACGKVATGVSLIRRRSRPQTGDIRDSEILVSGGGGVQRHFSSLESFAGKLGGMVAASRQLVDKGIAPRHIQVGQSGRTVSPRLYLALGIAGSIQHVVGLRNAGCIIAVNSDRHAPICSLSDMVVEGDTGEFLRRMNERLDGSRSKDVPDESSDRPYSKDGQI